jgi:hypothetical protein
MVVKKLIGAGSILLTIMAVALCSAFVIMKDMRSLELGELLENFSEQAEQDIRPLDLDMHTGTFERPQAATYALPLLL